MAVEPLDVAKFPAEFSAGTSPCTVLECVESVLGAANELREAAADSWGLLGLQEAVDFAAAVEDISRITDYLKLTAAAAIDQHHPASTLATTATLASTPTPGSSAQPLRIVDGQEDVPGPAGTVPDVGPALGGYGACSEAEPPALPKSGGRLREFRSTADFMRARLRISRAEARRRLAMATTLLPTPTLTGDVRPPAYPLVAQACADGVLAAADVDVIARALEEAVPRLEPEALEAMEKQLTDIGTYQDHDFLVRAAKHWTALLDQDQPPTEEELQQFQGIFPGRRRNGLNHLHIYCTDEQHEALTTLINSAANPRLSVQQESASAVGDGAPGPGASLPDGELRSAELSTACPENQDSVADRKVLDLLPRPTRPQLLLEGLLGAVRAALASGGLPAAGGLRPQVMVTISHDSLLTELANAPSGMGGSNHRDQPAGNEARTTNPQTPGTAAFSGPIDTRSVRRIACDADLIPIVLGSDGQVLDLGRAARLFPPHLRKALHARDGGCAFPGCTVPGPWTEAHHVTFWERGGGTGINNGVLLCSFHHHLIHQGNWQVSMRAGVPWFLPPHYVDPNRRPLRNVYFHPGFLAAGTSSPA